MKEIFGKKVEVKTKPKGYNSGYTFGNHPYYFAIAYNESFPKMGVVCKFSAYAWAEFKRLYEEEYSYSIYFYQFLLAIQSKKYTTRLSRIDLYVDYFNHSLSVNNIYKQLSNDPKEVIIKDYRGRSNFSKLSAVENDRIVSTFYVGSKRANTNALLRVYDKKLEQEQTYGFRLNDAKQNNDWVRFEVVYKGQYAHQLTAILLNEVTDKEKYQSLIAGKILEKFTFYDTKTEVIKDFSNDLKSIVNNEFLALKPINSRDHSLLRSIDYLTRNSGLNPTVFKIESIWGQSAVHYFFRYLYTYYSRVYNPNDDAKAWINKHSYSLSKLSFANYLEDPEPLKRSKNKDSHHTDQSK